MQTSKGALGRMVNLKMDSEIDLENIREINIGKTRIIIKFRNNKELHYKKEEE